MHGNSSETEQAEDFGREVVQAIRRGLGAPRLLDLEDFPHLRRLAGNQLRPPVRAVALNGLFERALGRLPEPNRQALEILGGMNEGSAGAPLGLRRESAARILDVAPNTFRTHREPRLIKELTQALSIVSSEAESDLQAAGRGGRRVDQVLVIHAAHSPAKGPLFDLLRTWGLRPLSLEPTDSLSAQDRLGLLATAVERVQVVVALIDPVAELKPGGPSKEVESAVRGNLLFELGYVLGIARQQTVIVLHGEGSTPTDLAGINVLKIDNRPSSRNALRTRLETLGCRLEGSLDWLDPAVGGDFDLRWDSMLGPDHDLHADLERYGYKLDTPLARRSSEETWLAHSRENQQERLIKVYRDLSKEERAFVRRSLELVSSLPALAAPSIDLLIEKEDMVAAVVDPPDGITLDEVGPVSPEEGVRIAMDLLRAVGELHDHGFLHRDISPSNVLLVKGGKPVLADLGIARPIAGLESEKGGARYLSEAAPQDDVQAIGKLLLFLVRSWRHSNGSQSSAGLQGLEVSNEFERVINRSLGQGVSCYQSAHAMRQDLEKVPEAERRDPSQPAKDP